MDKPNELKPCPFCGHEAKRDSYDIWEDGFDSAIQCSYCSATGGWRDSLEPESLRAERWNRRTPDRATLEEMVRRGIRFADNGHRPNGMEPEIRRIVSEYLAEQAGKETQ